MSELQVIINPSGISYADSYKQQLDLFDRAIEAKHRGELPRQYLIFNEHKPVITLGLNAKEESLLYPEEQIRRAGIDLVRTNRGGDATYHGPGQWTVYPILDLEQLHLGVRRYVAALEEVALTVLRRYGLAGELMDDAPGVWLHTDSYPRKVCALGVRASRFVTMHGIAFNVNTHEDAYHWINPCGFSDRAAGRLPRGLLLRLNSSAKALRSLHDNGETSVLIRELSGTCDRDSRCHVRGGRCRRDGVHSTRHRLSRSSNPRGGAARSA